MSPTSDEEELRGLFDAELERHGATLADPASSHDEKRLALHALKGAAGLVGEEPLADALGRLERRLRQGDEGALADAERTVLAARRSLSLGLPALLPSWPEPPPDLAPAPPLHDALRATYLAEMQDRIGRLDDALSSTSAPVVMLNAMLREVHALKGAAASVGDEATAWFCHGLEARLRAGQADAHAAREAIADYAPLRGVLLELGVDPARALVRLSAARAGDESARLRPLSRPPPAEDDVTQDGSLRIPSAALDRLVEQVGHVGMLGAQVGSSVRDARSATRALRQVSSLVAEALRLIGPSRPWGAPAAALSRLTEAQTLAQGAAADIDDAAAAIRDRSEALVQDAQSAATSLRELRRTRIGWLFDRVRASIEAQARREARALRVVTGDLEMPVDRRLLEQLLDPVLQLARNALAHAVEPPAARALLGKAPAATLRLSASFDRDRLRLTVEDDGPGVDMARVRERAERSGVLPADVAAEAGDEALIELLFLPGFTTREAPDVLAGRGMGLDLALGAVQRAGGSMHLSTRRGAGVKVAVDVPVEPGLVTVLWVRVSAALYGLPVRHVRTVALHDPAEPLTHLGALLLLSPLPAPRFAVELDPALQPGAAIRVGVDGIGAIEDVALRKLSPLVLAAGPYRGAVAYADGRLQFVLNVDGLLGALS